MSGVISIVIGAAKSAAAAIFTSLVPNGDFEQGALPAGWSFSESTSGISTTQSNSTSHSLNVKAFYDGDSDIAEAYYASSLLTVGERYSVSFWVYGIINANIYFGSTNAFVSGGTFGWSKISVLNYLCSGHTTFTLNTSGNNGSAFYIDDIVLLAGSTAG
jgi:predicted outer membrane repeat protein